MTKNICLYGGPGSGKSTSAAGLFYEMKRRHLKVEYVDEVAKSLVYSKDFITLSDQLMVFARQRHKMEKLHDQVDFTINDGPFLLSAIFSEYSDLKHLPIDPFNQLVIDTYKMYDTVNIFLNPADVEYQEYGRNESQEESIEIGNKIKNVMQANNIPYIEITVNDDIIKNVLSILEL